MPVRDLVAALSGGGAEVPELVRETARDLPYRDFITVGLLLSDLKVKPDAAEGAALIRDNWIYIQEPDVLVGRLQIFNNWSPYLVADPTKVWVGLEYFCNEGDPLWIRTDEQLAALGREELTRIGIIEHGAVLDSTVIRVEKTYPAYFGAYEHFDRVRAYLDPIENLFLIGRNGMHRYNNQDHSMLTAMTAVDNIIAGITDKSNIWAVNTEQDYHEESREPSAAE
jgi:protoporphyrinogen oxidase